MTVDTHDPSICICHSLSAYSVAICDCPCHAAEHEAHAATLPLPSLSDEDERLLCAAGFPPISPRPSTADRDTIIGVLAEHTIECTGVGEVSCRGCRETGWMSWTAYREHIADAIIAATAEPVGVRS